MKLAFFDTKSYDIPGFDRYAVPAGIEVKYYEPNLNRDTVSLANGFDAVCVFVNDTVDAVVVEKLYKMGVKAIVLRCAGFNNVDIKACDGKLRVFRVPAYSPHADYAEHAHDYKFRRSVRHRSEERRVGKECRSRWSPYH